ncbi:TrkH family potassium uptake protein [Pseudoprevotella muciniphila]|uniref:TrkH family potassium uptake protein n=1 Tax=Pseudoprevotella muciniphila TaxID=2133944 RepID=A0A5P8E5S7_9BACT|nr:TrkH family potassium uptake protein [Pseudoprevotella muciniphila]QFQ12276.1 TrkH family potassium uptake protein [Pseudoprevotella muciniphila]
MINYKIIARILCSMAVLETILLIVALAVGIFYGESGLSNFYWSVAISSAIAIALHLFGKDSQGRMTRREGYLSVAATWTLFTIIGALPFIFGCSTERISVAFFEAVSGFTTTGATALGNLDTLPHSILFWRSLMHWLGGLGIVFFTVAVLPSLGTGATKLFAAEATGVSVGKLHPRVQTTARYIWGIYISLFVACMFSLKIAGMGWFDAINHAMSTVSSGGFSTHQESIGYFHSPAIEYVLILFMFLSGVSFTMLFFLFIKHNFKYVFRDGELRTYIYILLGSTALITVCLLFDGDKVFSDFRNALFHVVSIQTTTGFTTNDFMVWPRLTWVILLVISVIGSCSGSTAGGVKCVRLVAALKILQNEFKRILHPKAVLPVRIGSHTIAEDIIRTIFAFFTIYIIIAIAGTMCYTLMDMPLLDAFGVTIALLGNIGPALGHTIGAVNPMGLLPDEGLWLGSFLMLAGRLEIFVFILPFIPRFWKKD